MATFNIEIEKILSDHADDLNAGRDTTRELVNEFGFLWPELDPMLQLAHSLKTVLVPQTAPRTIFPLFIREERRQRLSPIYVSQPKQYRWLWLGAAASLIAGGAGFVVWRRRKEHPSSLAQG